MKQIKLAFTVFFMLSGYIIFAQKIERKEYTKIKEELDRRIFNTTDPLFTDNSIPEKYKNESAIVLAEKHTLESDSRFKFLLLSTTALQYSFFDIYRRKIFINDLLALNKYSQTSFTKLQSKEWGIAGKIRNYTFLNIRIIKPGGEIKTVNVNESAVVIKDIKDEQQTKIAIPGLEKGDIIDYYVANYYQQVDYTGLSSIRYIFEDEYTILNYAVELQFDIRIAAEYQAINGAPDFTVTTADDGGKKLSLVVKNIPKSEAGEWSSVYRQAPIIRLHYRQGSIVHAGTKIIEEGQVIKTDDGYPAIVEDDLAAVFNQICKEAGENNKFYKPQYVLARKAWKEYTAKNRAADTRDSIAAFVYRYITWTKDYSNFSLGTNFNKAHTKRELHEQMQLIAEFAYILLHFKTEIDFVIGIDKYGYRREDLFSIGDLSIMAGTQGRKPQYFSFADNLDFPQMIPQHLDGTEITVFHFDINPLIDGKKLYVSSKNGRRIKLPATDCNTNYRSELVTVNTDPASPGLINVKRTVMLWGYLKKKEQASRVTFEEMAKETGRVIDERGDIPDGAGIRSRNTVNTKDELKTLLEKAKEKQKKNAESELETTYDTKLKKLNSYTIVEYGLQPEIPFSFQEDFTVENWIKKAGENYVFDIGRFLNEQIKIKKDQEDRGDIYIPFPLSISYHIELFLPPGYTVVGEDKLISKYENEKGGFTCNAKKEKEKLTIDITNKFSTSYIPASERWELISLLDQLETFKNQKILLKKI